MKRFDKVDIKNQEQANRIKENEKKNQNRIT
jgi:hypothetical protein